MGRRNQKRSTIYSGFRLRRIAMKYSSNNATIQGHDGRGWVRLSRTRRQGSFRGRCLSRSVHRFSSTLLFQPPSPITATRGRAFGRRSRSDDSRGLKQECRAEAVDGTSMGRRNQKRSTIYSGFRLRRIAMKYSSNNATIQGHDGRGWVRLSRTRRQGSFRGRCLSRSVHRFSSTLLFQPPSPITATRGRAFGRRSRSDDSREVWVRLASYTNRPSLRAGGVRWENYE